MQYEKYKKYAQAQGANTEVVGWVTTNLVNALKKITEDQTEIEHIIDYLVSEDAPKRLRKMSYDEAKNNAHKWNKKLQKLGNSIVESDGDTELLKDFGDGFKIVKLIGKNAYEREGFLMRHCVASYYGKDTEVYSLRDAKNMPHCTMEKDQQIKGKGNGSINPKYVGYIVAFLQEIGMGVGDNEMKNLGYVNVEKLKDVIDFGELFNGKYFFKDNLDKIHTKDDLRLFNIFGLIEIDTNLNAVLRFDIDKSIDNLISSTLAARNWSTLAAQDGSTLAARDSSTLAARDSSTLAARNWSTLAARDSSTLAAQDGSTLAARENSVMVAGTNSKAKGSKGSVIVLYNRDAHGHVIDYACGVVGVDLEDDVFYVLSEGRLVKESTNDEKH